MPPQGYAWWYIDAISDDGRYGFSIIALIGSVFSPYYAWSGRDDPQNHVALNVALYGNGVNRWTMTERGRTSLSRDKNQLTIGPSHVRWDGTDLVIDICEWTVPIPRRVNGTIRLKPSWITETAYELDAIGRHFWQPIAPAARVEVEFENPDMNWNGEAYMDSNWGSEPLENGFQHWNWSRAALRDGAGVYYDAVTRDGKERQLALRFDKTGAAHQLDFPQRQPLPPGAIWLVTRNTPTPKNFETATISVLEDTPFYTRSHLDTVFDGQRVVAVHESLDLNRFAKTWVRCLLPFRMPRKA